MKYVIRTITVPATGVTGQQVQTLGKIVHVISATKDSGDSYTVTALLELPQS